MNSFIDDGGPIKGETVKKCMPFLDAMTLGYTIPLWSDVAYKTTEDNVELSWRDSIFDNSSLFDNHAGEQIEGSPFYDVSCFGKNPMKFKNPWIIKTEPGISCLFTAPLNQVQDLFHILTGVVDTDEYFNEINFPFIWLKSNTSGILKQGMPLVQVIPFKRDVEKDYEVNVLSEDDKMRNNKVKKILGTQIYDGYKNYFRYKKNDREETENKCPFGSS